MPSELVVLKPSEMASYHLFTFHSLEQYGGTYYLTLMLLVATSANTKLCKKAGKWLKP